MAKLIWFNQPTNHSGWANFLYLTPDGDVEKFRIEMADPGSYILGGPVLSDGYHLTDAAQKLIWLLPAGIHFFPESSASDIRQEVVEKRDVVSDDSHSLDSESWSHIHIYSKAYSTTQCCDMLLNNSTPSAPIVFIDRENEGDVLLVPALARVYYGLPKELRDELRLEADWDHQWMC